MKVAFFDRIILIKFVNIVAVISSLVGIFAISFNVNECRWIWFIVWGVLLVLIYLCIYFVAKRQKKIKFKVDGTIVNVYFGDIFRKEDGLKVIPMNEYFDTQVDDKVISKISLHGQYLLNYCKDISSFEKLVENTLKPVSIEEDRNVNGHKKKYDLGSLVENDGFILTAFTKFDKNNKANLDGKDYLYFWGSFWMNLDKVFAGRNVYIPLFGTGMTRIADYDPAPQEVLENILHSMRITGFKNKNSGKSVNIVIHESFAKDINLYRLKEKVGD